jgi:putative ubiquitin-RnfH superfamily antitoxin RatB of RatAB toxin-antitoxin module
VIRVELVRAWRSRSETRSVELPDQACVGDALTASGWVLDEDFIGLGIFGVAATPATCLRDGDRVELLRGLQTDPKQARRLRAQRSIPPMQK